MNVVKQTAFNVATISDQMGIITSEVKNLKLEQIRLADGLDKVNSRMQKYEDNVRVTRHQAQNLRNTIHAKAATLLEIEYKDGIITTERGLYNDKYYRSGFISRLYVDARKQSRLGTPYTETLQRDYEECLKFIADWNPPTGVEGYKRYLDARRRK
jgi:hypothetical protein